MIVVPDAATPMRANPTRKVDPPQAERREVGEDASQACPLLVRNESEGAMARTAGIV